MADTDDWADRKARLIAPLQLWRLPTAIASALRDARREGYAQGRLDVVRRLRELARDWVSAHATGHKWEVSGITIAADQLESEIRKAGG